MVDFGKKLSNKYKSKPIIPIDIYNSLDRKSETGTLRPAQEFILNEWINTKDNDRDIIIKLHTGEGKTLIGLLILQSRINSGKFPVLYLCANKYLVQQTCNEAEKFGIPYCLIEEDNELPAEFHSGEKILITNAQKLFNGKTIFGIKNKSTKVHTIILDDSHACIDTIKNSFTIKLKSTHEVYKAILSIFDDDLKEQGEGSLLDIKEGDYETTLPIPYWAWFEKNTEILKLLSKNKDDKAIKFAWPILKNKLLECNVFVSGTECEIVPFYVPIDTFGTFHSAEQRILMSATTQDDSFFIKGLSFDDDSIRNPLVYDKQKWSGEKMFIIPSLMSDNLDRDLMVTKFGSTNPKTFGIVAITPSFKRAEQYGNLGALIADSNEKLFELVNKLKNKEFAKPVILVNRYDGIDLPDASCRILIIDSKPYFDSLSDRYEENCRVESELINIKVAQKIEQGLGRSVRGEKDYSAIILIGSDLIKFIKGSATSRYFSQQTLKQIELGIEIARDIVAEKSEEQISFNDVRDLINQFLKRDPNWKEYYLEKMETIKDQEKDFKVLELLRLEKEADDYFINGDYENNIRIYQKIIDKYCYEDSEKGWYLQLIAKTQYLTSKSESNKYQVTAYKKNTELLKPIVGITYNKLNYIHESRIRRIKSWMNLHSNPEDLILDVKSILDSLSFDIASETFEKALLNLGTILGFLSQRPEKEFRRGPDNLWCGVYNQFILFECKNKVENTREYIYKSETGQMNNSCGWFKENYSDSAVTNIMIITTRTLAHDANFSDDVKIMRKGKLNLLKKNVSSFFREFRNQSLKDVTDEKVNELLNFYKLDIKSIQSEYVEDWTRK